MYTIFSFVLSFIYILNCHHPGLGINNCRHDEDAAVKCGKEILQQ